MNPTNPNTSQTLPTSAGASKTLPMPIHRTSFNA